MEKAVVDWTDTPRTCLIKNLQNQANIEEGNERFRIIRED